MSDSMDKRLRELGEGTPFPVDWRAYEAEVLRRLAVEQQRERRRRWLWAAGSAFCGAAAMFVLMIWTIRTDAKPAEGAAPLMQVNNPSEPPPVHIPTPAGSPNEPVFVRANGKPEGIGAPFTRRIVRKDGRVGEIRFGGFSSADAPEGEISFISIVESGVR